MIDNEKFKKDILKALSSVSDKLKALQVEFNQYKTKVEEIKKEEENRGMIFVQVAGTGTQEENQLQAEDLALTLKPIMKEKGLQVIRAEFRL